MGAKLYKYLGPEIVGRAFEERGACTFKCSLPRDFNDPFELFLTIDYQQDPDVLAYYREVIGEIPQRATTCFSRSPEVIPMWAHYAENHTGIVLEVDEDCVSETHPETAFGDVEYLAEADPGILAALHHAQTTCKPRHVYMLQKAVLSAAYYTKHTCWAHEQERRLLAHDDDIVTVDGLLLFPVSIECITAVIVGYRATDAMKEALKKIAAATNSRYLEMRIGRSSIKPHFVDEAGAVWVFDEGQIIRCKSTCLSCGQPVDDDKDTCSWCAITSEDDEHAARRNPMRMLSSYGMLEGYYKDTSEIDRRFRKKE